MNRSIPALLLSLLALSSSAQSAEFAPNLGAFYAQDKVQEIEIFTSQWDNMKNQDPRGGRCNFGYIGPDRYDWFSFEEVRVNGVAFHGVGVKKKSWCGSESKDKPSMNIKFDKFNDALGKQAEDILGTDSLTLNNSIQDPAYVRQCLSYQLWSQAGVPAPLCNFARVRVNGQDMGVFVNLQPMKKTFLKAHYGKEMGNLYEFALENFEPWARDRLAAALDSMKKVEDTSLRDMDAIIDAVSDHNGNFQKIEALVDIDQYLRFWAMEIILAHWDSMSLSGNNSYVYFPGDGKMKIMPWGTDQVLMSTDDRGARNLYADNRLARKLAENPAIRQRLIDTINHQLNTIWNERDLMARVDHTANMIRPFVPGWEQGRFQSAMDGLKWNMRIRREQVATIIGGGFADHFGIRLQNAEGNRFCLNTETFGENRVINTWTCDTHPDQYWNVTRLQGDYVRIVNPSRNTCINLQGDAEGTAVNGWSCDRHPDQTWRVRESHGALMFESQRAPGMCLSLGQQANAAQAVIKNCNPNDASQNWRRF